MPHYLVLCTDHLVWAYVRMLSLRQFATAYEHKPILDDLCIRPGNVAFGMFQNISVLK